MDCVFCKMINKEIPARFVYEDEDVVAVLDINPRSKGHTMVIPRFHAPTILELPDDKIESLFSAVKKVTKKLENSLNPDGFTMGINHKEISGQTVDHLHFHIIPRFKGDGGGSVHSVVNNPPKESLEEIQKEINNQ